MSIVITLRNGFEALRFLPQRDAALLKRGVLRRVAVVLLVPHRGSRVP